MADTVEVRLQARETREATVTANGNGAHVGIPKDWLGEDILIVRLPPKVKP